MLKLSAQPRRLQHSTRAGEQRSSGQPKRKQELRSLLDDLGRCDIQELCMTGHTLLQVYLNII